MYIRVGYQTVRNSLGEYMMQDFSHTQYHEQALRKICIMSKFIILVENTVITRTFFFIRFKSFYLQQAEVYLPELNMSS